MFTRFSPNIQGILYGFVGFGSYSIADATAKYLTQFYSVFQMVAFEALLMMVIGLIFARPMGGLMKTLRTRQLKTHILRGLCNMLITLLATFGFYKLPMTLVYTLLFISPFITALLAIPIFKEKVDTHGWIAIAAGFTGVLIVMRPGMDVFDPWVLLPLLAAFFIAVGFLLSRALKKDETLLSYSFFSGLTSVICLMPFVITIYGLPEIKHLWVFLFGSLAFMGGQVFLVLGLQRGKSSLVAPIQYSQIIWGAALGYLLFGDIPDLWTLIGAAIIIGSGLYLLETERKLTQKMLAKKKKEKA